jgi:hypothetical protein
MIIMTGAIKSIPIHEFKRNHRSPTNGRCKRKQISETSRKVSKTRKLFKAIESHLE